MNKIVIDRDICKGCGLCIEYCPIHIIQQGQESNRSGYLLPVQVTPEKCTACKLCATMCPDSAIEVFKN